MITKPRNVIHNGNFNVWQRGTSAITAAFPAVFTADRWSATEYSDGTYTIARSTDVPNSASQFSLKATCTGADGTIAADQVCWIQHTIEASDYWDMLGGRPSWTLSFWVKSYQTGIFCVSLREYTSNTASYVAEYTVNASATWEKKVIRIPAPGAVGSWTATPTNGALSVNFSLAVGSTWQIAANAWSATNDFGTSNQTNFMSSTDNYLYLSQVQLEAGSAATEFDAIMYSDELSRCHRYLIVFGGQAAYERVGVGYIPTSSIGSAVYHFDTEMRAIPTPTYTDVGHWTINYGNNALSTCTAISSASSTTRLFNFQLTATGSPLTVGECMTFMSNNNTAARLYLSAEI